MYPWKIVNWPRRSADRQQLRSNARQAPALYFETTVIVDNSMGEVSIDGELVDQEPKNFCHLSRLAASRLWPRSRPQHAAAGRRITPVGFQRRMELGDSFSSDATGEFGLEPGTDDRRIATQQVSSGGQTDDRRPTVGGIDIDCDEVVITELAQQLLHRLASDA